MRAVDFALVLCVAVDFIAAAPARRGAKQPHPVLAPQAYQQQLAVGRKSQLRDGVGQARDALDHGAAGTLKQVDIVVCRPAAHGHSGSVGRHGSGKQAPVVVCPNRWAQGLQQTPAGQVPDAGGFVIRSGDGIAACCINAQGPNGGVMGAGVNAQERCVHRLRMDRLGTQGAGNKCERRQAC